MVGASICGSIRVNLDVYGVGVIYRITASSSPRNAVLEWACRLSSISFNLTKQSHFGDENNL